MERLFEGKHEDQSASKGKRKSNIEKERKQLQELLSELAIIAERLLVKIGEKPAFPKDPTRIENVLAFLKEDKKIMSK